MEQEVRQDNSKTRFFTAALALAAVIMLLLFLIPYSRSRKLTERIEVLEGQLEEMESSVIPSPPVEDTLPEELPDSGEIDNDITFASIEKWIEQFSYISEDNGISKDYLLSSGFLGFDWLDAEVSNSLTVDSGGYVSWPALTTYPNPCPAGKAVSAIGDTLTCVDLLSSLWSDSGSTTYLSDTSDDLAVGGTGSSAPFFMDTGTGILYISQLRVGDSTNYLSVDDHGFLTLHGTATTYDDLRVPISSTKAGSSKIPGFTQFKDDGSGSQGVFTYHFDSNVEEELYFTVQLPHGWKDGSNIYPHVHWTPTTAGAGTVVWGLEYTWANIHGTFGDTTIITQGEATDGAFKHEMTTFSGGVDATGQTYSSMLLCRIFRDATDGSDTYADDAAMLEIDFHYTIEKSGTDTPIP